MNKYKKALAKVRDDCFWSSHDKGYEYITKKTFEKLDLLQDVVNKETPMKTNWAEQGRRRCSRCDQLWHMSAYRFFYCPRCGQKIDWSDQDER